MRAYTSSQFVLPLPAGHRFPMEKYRLLAERVAQELPAVRLTDAPAADDAALSRVHSARYIAAVSDGSLTAEEQRAIGFPWSPAMAERARRSVGATVAAARTALSEGVALNLAGGTHHAHADHGAGFCVYNDVAVAARALQAAQPTRPRTDSAGAGAGVHVGASNRGDSAQARVAPDRHSDSPSDYACHGVPGTAKPAPFTAAVIDLDVHQGDGTAAIFAGDDSVVTLSLHGAKNYPFAKESSDIDLPLPDGCDDDAYLAALDTGMAALWQRLGDRVPSIAFYLAGADPHEGDRLGRLKLTTAGLAERDRRVFTALHARRVPAVVMMAGGYGRSMEETLAVQMGTVRAALVGWQAWQTWPTQVDAEPSSAVNAANATHGPG